VLRFIKLVPKYTMKRVKKTLHLMQHSAITPASGVINWCFDNYQNLSVIRMNESPRYPKLKDIDLLVLNGTEEFMEDISFISEEKKFVQSAIESGVPCLGLNIGADVLAEALSEKKSPKSKAQRGWNQVIFNKESETSAVSKLTLSGIQSMSGFFHRSRRNVLPDECHEIGQTESGETAAFLYGDHVIGMYFAPELNPHTISTLASYHDIVPQVSADGEKQKMIIPHDFGNGRHLIDLALDYLIKSGKNNKRRR
jgi:GMP synthase-like glutamine amidotransferase